MTDYPDDKPDNESYRDLRDLMIQGLQRDDQVAASMRDYLLELGVSEVAAITNELIELAPAGERIIRGEVAGSLPSAEDLEALVNFVRTRPSLTLLSLSTTLLRSSLGVATLAFDEKEQTDDDDG